jgi:hypothetical protein
MSSVPEWLWLMVWLSIFQLLAILISRPADSEFLHRLRPSLVFENVSMLKRFEWRGFSGRNMRSVSIFGSLEILAESYFLQCRLPSSIRFEWGSTLTWVKSQAFREIWLIDTVIPAWSEVLEEDCFSKCESSLLLNLNLSRNCHELQDQHSMQQDWLRLRLLVRLESWARTVLINVDQLPQWDLNQDQDCHELKREHLFEQDWLIN